MLGLSCSFGVQCALPAPSGNRASTRNSPWFSSALSNPSHWPRMLWCSATECQCSMILLAALTSPHCTFAGLRTCWAEYHCCRASWMETRLQPCLTVSVTDREQWLTADMAQGMAARSMSSTPGCGVMAGASHAGLLSLRPSSSERPALSTLVSRLQPLWSDAERSAGLITAPAGCRTQARTLHLIKEKQCYITCDVSYTYIMLYNIICYITPAQTLHVKQCYITC